MKPIRVLLAVWMLAGVGAVLGAILGNAVGKALLGAVVARGWRPRS